MDKTMLETLLTYEGENGKVFKSDVLLAMLMPYLSEEGQKIAQIGLEVKSEIDKERSQTQSTSSSKVI